jgi:membrane-associated phospholipid phosphatase
VTDADVPGQSHFGPAVDALDTAAERLLDPVRGHPIADQLFHAANHAGDFSLIWHVLSMARGLARRRPDQVIVLAAALGIESLVVNQGLKRTVRRQRPTVSGDERYQVRRPSTSSFPSGHASSAAFNASLMIAWDGKRWAPLWISVAAIVGISRAYVRIHHASDVVGGAVVGLVLARLVRPIVRRLAP